MTEFRDRLQAALAPDYQLVRELGGAGMSRVFVATEAALGRTVVVKVLPPDLAAGVNVERFRREIQLAAQLQHPHIVPLLATGDDHGLLWFSMPYIEGESLRGALTRQQRLSPRDVVRILHDVVDALAYAHARGVVHRDIKPDNILTSGMHALVTDFGVAKALSAASPVHGGTTTGMAIGTPAYMAPEQLAADPAADHRVDLYAVGLLAYELLTGKSPFSGVSPQATLAAQLTQMPEPPHRSLSDVPEPLSQLIMHCLEKDAARRPQTATALLAELEALPPMSSGATAAVRRRRPGPAVLAGTLLVVAALGWGMWSSRDGGGALAALDARDAGPGGDVSRPMSPSSGPVAGLPMDSLEARAMRDTAPVFRDVGDGARGTVVPLVITRAESLAIADAVRKRQAMPQAPATAARPVTASGSLSGATGNREEGARIVVRLGGDASAEFDRALLLEEVSRIFADSMSRAIKHMDSTLANTPRFVRMVPPSDPRTDPRVEIRRDGFDARTAPRAPVSVTPLLAPPGDARLRVVVANFTNATGRRDLNGVARDAATQLRESIPADRFDVVSTEVTEKATRSLPDKMSVGWALRADFVVSGWMMTRGDSVAMVTMLTDVRTGRFTRATESVVTGGATPGVETAQKQMRAWLDTAATLAARRRTAETARR